MSAPRVVIVGGGFGGLFATRALARASVNVVLIDKRNYHLFRPMLYQVATGLLCAEGPASNPKGWVFEVNLEAEIVRPVIGDAELEKKYSDWVRDLQKKN